MKNYSRTIILLFVAAIFGSAATMAATSVINTQDKYQENPAEASTESPSHNFIRTAQSHNGGVNFVSAAEITVNTVVSIKSFAVPAQNQSQFFNFMDPFEFFFGPGNGRGNSNPQKQQQQRNQEPQQTGLGSGVIISSDGYIVTNNHVVDGASKLEVTLNDNRTFNAKIIGTDSSTDLALIKIEATDLTPIIFGDSDNLKVGEWVLAVGNPFGFTSTVTAGIVSAKARSISTATNAKPMGIESFIQTDAAVNPGNSGGALVNTEGQLVGINTAIYSQTGSYAGYSFAIPSAIVKKVVSDIKQYGAVQRAFLGIAFGELTSDLAKEKKITSVSEGIYVGKVENQGAAMEGGIKVGDVITAINDTPVKNNGTLQAQMSKLRPGDKIKITYVRDNKFYSTTVVLKNNLGNTGITTSTDAMNLGCAFKVLTPERLKELQISSGLEVVGLKDGKFKNAGIKNGFIITDINNATVSNSDDVNKIYKAIMDDTQSDKVMFITGIYPTGKKMYYAVDLAN